MNARATTVPGTAGPAGDAIGATARPKPPSSAPTTSRIRRGRARRLPT